MPTPTPAGTISTYLDVLKDTIAKSTKYQTHSDNAGDEAGAKTTIVEVSNASGLPRTLVGTGREFAVDRDAFNSWTVTGPLEAIFEFLVSTAYINDFDGALREWRNKVGEILDDIMDLVSSNPDTVLDLRRLEIVGDEEMMTERDTSNKFISGTVEFTVQGLKA